jgi:cell division protein FtsB
MSDRTTLEDISHGIHVGWLQNENKELRARITELEKENYNLQHSITQAIDPLVGERK